MRISDWSSDVCSSDLHDRPCRLAGGRACAAALVCRARSCDLGQPHSPPAPGNHLRSGPEVPPARSEEHTSELQSLMRISYAVFCLKKKKKHTYKKCHNSSL